MDFLTHPTLKNNLLFYWTLDSDMSDSSGNGKNGTLYNTPTFPAGKVRNGLHLDGVNQYGEALATGLNPGNQGACAVSFWFYIDSWAEGATVFSNQQCIWFDLATSGTRKLKYTFWTGSYRAGGWICDVEVGQWYHVVLNRYGGLPDWNYVYVNGVNVWSNNWFLGASYSVGNVRLGYTDSAEGAFFHGKTDEVSAWSGRTLTSQEIADLYNGGAGISWTGLYTATKDINTNDGLKANLAAYLTLDSGLQDSHTGAHHGVLFGSPTYPIAKLRTGLKLNGVDEYGKITTHVDFDGANLGYSFWFKARDLIDGATVYSRGYAGAGDYVRFRLVDVGSSVFKLKAMIRGNGNDHDLATTTSILAETYYHVMVNYDSTGTMKLYLNGTEEASVSASGHTPSISGKDLFLGRNASPLFNKWAQRFPSASPSARYLSSMAYDASRGVIVLFGGSAGAAETWEYDGVNWTLMSPSASPPAREGHRLVYDSCRREIVLFGGKSGGTHYQDTWTYNGTTWTQKSPGTVPGVRQAHTMVFDSKRGRVVMFGGHNGSVDNNNTYEWDGSNWYLISPGASPSARSWHAMAFDPARGITVMFGGNYNGGSAYQDTWEYDGTTWTERASGAVTKPPARHQHMMEFHIGVQRAMLWGGAEGAVDTWAWDGSTWAQMTLDAFTNAGGSTAAAVAYDPRSQRLITFGGNESSSPVAKTYEGGNFWGCFPGVVDDIGFWTKALSSDERSNLWNSGIGITWDATCTSISTHPTLRYGLQACWPFDVDATDVTGNGFHGVPQNSPSLVSGKVGNCYSLAKASSQAVVVANAGAFNVSAFSMAVWFNVTSFDGSAPGVIIAKRNSDSSRNQFIYQHLNNSDKRTELSIWTSNGEVYVYGNVAVAGSWRHGVLTCSGTEMKLYEDGALVNTSAMTGTVNAIIDDLIFGSMAGATKNYLDGKVDQPIFWNRVLTQAEVTDLYNSGSGLAFGTPYTEAFRKNSILHHPTLADRLVAYYKLDGNANDAHVNGLSGTAEGTPTWPTSSSYCRLRQGLQLNGSSQCINLGTSSKLCPGNITLACWAYTDSTGGSYQAMINKRYYAPGGGYTVISYIFALYLPTNLITAVVSSGDSAPYWHQIDYSAGSGIRNSWHHYAMTYDGAVLAVYLDGMLKQTLAGCLGPIKERPTIATLIGARTGDSGEPSRSDYFKGYMDEVLIAGRAYSPQEVLDLYHSAYPLRYNEVLIPNLAEIGGDAVSNLVANGVIPAGKDYYPAAHPTDHARDLSDWFQIGRKCLDESPWTSNAELQKALLKADPSLNALIRSDHPQHAQHVGMGAGVYIKRRS